MTRQKGIRLKITFTQGIITLVLLLIMVVLPARIYDVYLEPEYEKQGQVAGVYTQNFYENKIKSNIEPQGQLDEIDFTSPKYNLVTIAGVVTLSSSILLTLFFLYEQYQKQKFASPDL